MNRTTPLPLRRIGLTAVLFSCATTICHTASPTAERELLAAYVPAEFGDQSVLATGLRRHIALSDSENWTLTTARRQKPSEGQRWVNFEDEFGVHDRRESWMLSGVQSAKYQLDKTVFALDMLVENVERAIQLEYDVARGQMQLGAPAESRPPVRTYSDPWRDVWENARIRSDVDLDVFSGRAWVGFRLVIPIGD